MPWSPRPASSNASSRPWVWRIPVLKAQTASTILPWYSERPTSTDLLGLIELFELIGLFDRALRYGSFFLCGVGLLLFAAMAQGQGQEQRESASSSPFTRHSLDAISGKA